MQICRRRLAKSPNNHNRLLVESELCSGKPQMVPEHQSFLALLLRHLRLLREKERRPEVAAGDASGQPSEKPEFFKPLLFLLGGRRFGLARAGFACGF